jgi:hypothetical protein
MAEIIKKIYNLKFGVDIGSFKRDPNDKKTWNTADTIVYIPITREFPAEPNKGQKQFGLFSVDGYFKTPVPDFELLECLLFLAKSLQNSQELKDWQKKEIDQFINSFSKKVIEKGRYKTSD